MSSRKRCKTYPLVSKEVKKESDSESESDSDSVSDSESETSDVQIDFSGFELAPCDLTGIKLLLNQLFVKADIDITDLSSYLIDQLDIGTVIKETEIDESTQNDDDTNEDDTVYALVSVVSLSQNNDIECIRQLRRYFSDLKKQPSTGTDQALSFISSILDDPKKIVGLIINERYSNLPSVISVPSFTKLKNEIETSSGKDTKYRFTHYIMICKLYKTHSGSKKKAKKTDDKITWCNPEDEIFDQEAEARYEFSVSKQIDSGISGSWTEDDVELLPFRRILAFSARKFDDILQKLSTFAK